ncbi:hypothetical protein GGR92_003630 [Spirosoma lacussanchae]|uniref:hypothetical protein n=1 Tax=Spirosoma lacussanchae TaxID=1884249 RepID=UPI001109799E|nr:hypothetical protein [Spirosoma lacussanchae]
MTTTKLNPVQLHLLQLFSHDLSQNELTDIKRLLADYFVQKADEEMASLQQQKPTTQADLDALLNTHLRTPYKTQ